MKKVFAIAKIVVKEMYRRKDFYVLFILTALITGTMGSVVFFNEPKIVRYLKEICLMLIWISALLIAISTAARQIPAERENRTIFPLMAKPVARRDLIFGKFLGCWLATGFALLLFYIFFASIAISREQTWLVLNYFQAWSLQWAMLGIVISLTLLGSLVFTAPSSNMAIVLIFSVFVLLVGRHLNKVAMQLSEPGSTLLYAIYYLIPHLELFDVRDLIVHNWALIEWKIWILAIGYAAIYTAVFLLGAWAVFNRKPLLQ